MNRSTWIGRLFRSDRDAARREVVRVLRRHRGCMKRAAVDLGIDRRHLQRYLWRESLWHEIDEIRAEAARIAKTKVSWIEQTRKALATPFG